MTVFLSLPGLSDLEGYHVKKKELFLMSWVLEGKQTITFRHVIYVYIKTIHKNCLTKLLRACKIFRSFYFGNI